MKLCSTSPLNAKFHSRGELYSRVQESVVILAVSLFGLQHACEFADHICFVERSCGIHRFPELPVEDTFPQSENFSAGFVNVFGYGIDRIRIEQVRNRTVLSGIVRIPGVFDVLMVLGRPRGSRCPTGSSRESGSFARTISAKVRNAK